MTRSPASLALPCALAALCAGGCPKDPPAAVVGDAGAAVVGDAGAAAGTGEVVVFTGAPGWTGGRACTDVNAEDGCDSQWLHTSGQVVRVFVVPVKDAAALTSFVDKLAADVAQKGGVVDRFTDNGLTLVRFLQAVRSDQREPDGAPGHADAGAHGAETHGDLAAINYALVGRDQRAVHLITSVVAFDEQQAADARVRALLASAAWQPAR